MNKVTNQLEFSSVFFDTLFGLIIFFNIDGFLQITDPIHFIFYLMSVIIVAHWWLMFKSVDDNFGTEATKSASDLLFGIVYIIFLAYFVNFASNFNVQVAIFCLGLVFLADLVWSTSWYYLGEWSTKDHKRIRFMEFELVQTIRLSGITTVVLFGLCFLAPYLEAIWIVTIFIAVYLSFILLTFRKGVVDFEVF